MKGVKNAVAASCLLAAGIIVVLFWGNEEAIPDTDEFNTTWRCATCKHQFVLTGRQYEEASAKTSGSEPFFCTACPERTAYRVAQCIACQTWYFGSEVPGQTGRCPVCEPAYEPEIVIVDGPKPNEETADVIDVPIEKRRAAPSW